MGIDSVSYLKGEYGINNFKLELFEKKFTCYNFNSIVLGKDILNERKESEKELKKRNNFKNNLFFEMDRVKLREVTQLQEKFGSDDKPYYEVIYFFINKKKEVIILYCDFSCNLYKRIDYINILANKSSNYIPKTCSINAALNVLLRTENVYFGFYKDTSTEIKKINKKIQNIYKPVLNYSYLFSTNLKEVINNVNNQGIKCKRF